MGTRILRPERPSEYRAMEEIVREAFWDKFSPGCSEHLVVHHLRGSAEAVPELCLAAEENGSLAGGIWYARAAVRNGNSLHPVLTMGPVCVKPDRQGQGIGGALIRKTLADAEGLAPAVIIYGDLNYYRRFGFRPASEFGITDSEGHFHPAILLRPLSDSIPRGAFEEGDVYHVTPEEVRAFDRTFPHRQKHYRPGQLFFAPPSPPPDDPLLRQSWELRRRAESFLRESHVLEAWESMGGKVRGVGSFRSGLMMKHRDIDLHIYTDRLDERRTREALEPVLASGQTVGLDLIDLSHTEECCFEWHLRRKDEIGEIWKLDMIQILSGTKYDGLIEDTTEAVTDILTPALRKRILALKDQCPDDLHICGIEYCKAVIADGVTTWPQFMAWREKNPPDSLLNWRPAAGPGVI